MKIVIFLLLITYIFTVPSTVSLDLKEDQSLTVGTAGSVIVVVTADEAITLTALSNILLKKNDDDTKTITLTCTINTPASKTVTEVTCTTSAPTTAGTYNLVADGSISMTATYGTDTPVSATTTIAGTKTVTVNSADSPTPPTSVTLDLKASQKLTTTDTSVILEVKANNAMSLSALTNLVLQSTETPTTTFALTCSFTTPVSCAKDTAKEVTCKVATPTTAGTYKLAAAADKSITMTATYGSNNAAVSVTPAVAATPTSLTVSTASSNENTNPSGEGESDDDNSSFLKLSYIMFFIAFLF